MDSRTKAKLLEVVEPIQTAVAGVIVELISQA